MASELDNIDIIIFKVFSKVPVHPVYFIVAHIYSHGWKEYTCTVSMLHLVILNRDRTSRESMNTTPPNLSTESSRWEKCSACSSVQLPQPLTTFLIGSALQESPCTLKEYLMSEAPSLCGLNSYNWVPEFLFPFAYYKAAAGLLDSCHRGNLGTPCIG